MCSAWGRSGTPGVFWIASLTPISVKGEALEDPRTGCGTPMGGCSLGLGFQPDQRPPPQPRLPRLGSKAGSGFFVQGLTRPRIGPRGGHA